MGKAPTLFTLILYVQAYYYRNSRQMQTLYPNICKKKKKN